MSFFEIFNPGSAHQRKQRDFDKVHVLTQKQGGRGPMQVDLDKGTIVLPTKKDAPAASPELAEDELADRAEVDEQDGDED